MVLEAIITIHFQLKLKAKGSQLFLSMHGINAS